MSLNTLKTVYGYLITLLEKYTWLRVSRDTLAGIYNVHRISERLCTSGQPTEGQFQAIRDAGYKAVINLAPHDAENALANEATLVTELGLDYIHIPVDFSCPTEKDFQQFVSAMSTCSGVRLWVHCAANMRVSAFVYRYRCDVQGMNRQEARSDLRRIWEPFGVWKKFVSGA